MTSRQAAVAAMSLFVLLFLTGCKISNDAAAKSSDSNINRDEEARKQQERESQTLWFVIDENGKKLRNLPDDDPEVMGVNKLMVLHSDVVDNLNYRSLNVKDEFRFYSQGFKEQLNQEGYPQVLLLMYKDNEIVLKLNRLAWYEMAFHRNFKTARLKTESEIVIERCSQEYMDKYKLKLGQAYVQPRIVDLVKEGSEWKIARIDKGPFVVKPSSPGK
ncbi:hypothetical protein [Cohnella silvisoli]|uniref:Lipoprotein n=1 Tax=Cohnella silvisoli TaxID=2873699 RepID=A0ABV1KSH0_9BACL|nr:hypothetical protein [Cohnella silvisoli]MCD9022646.1 hypothetical protein [Cohnella silvisoli]